MFQLIFERSYVRFVSASFVYFDVNEKNVSNVTTLTLSIHHPLIRKQMILAILNGEGENTKGTDFFWDIEGEH